MFRIGLLVPSSNTTMEPDFYRMAPEGVCIHSARMSLLEFTSQALLKMADEAQREAGLLASASVDVIVYGCSTCSLIGGVDWEAILVDQIRFNTGTSVIIANRAVVEALMSLGDGGIGVVTPYSEEINWLERRYLESHGLRVTAIRGLGLSDVLEVGRTKEEAILQLVEQAAERADILYISCTNLPVIHIIEKIESEWGIPVVTSNQASLWAALEPSKVRGIEGYGTLLRDI